MSDNNQKLETLAVHAGQVPDPTTGSRAVPIYQTTSYVFNDTEHAANLFGLKAFGNIYTRLMNPTNDVLEQRLAAMDGGAGALSLASGQAAIFYAITAITSVGQNIVVGGNLYGGTVNLFRHTLKRFGIEARFVDSNNLDEVRAAFDENTRLLYTESVGNPAGNVDDFEALGRIAHEAGVPFIVDNTFTPPPLFNPFNHGADIIVYSLTKMIGGHGTSIGGAIIEKGDFNWKAGNKYPEITEPDVTYHGVNFWDAFGGHENAVAPGLAYVLKIRTGLLRDTGACLSPFNAHQFILGVETLPLRARAHTQNAQKVAEYLSKHPAVTYVNYAGLPGHRDYDNARKYMPEGPGAVFTFGLKGGIEAGRRFINSVKLASHLANVLDAKTLVIHNASTTHQQLTEEELVHAGVDPEAVRISVGIENADDIIADLDQAIAASQEPVLAASQG